MQSLISWLDSPIFSRLTHRAFYLLLLLTNLAIPLGQHRAWGGLPGWWVFPAIAALTFCSVHLYLIDGNHLFALCSIPYALLYAFDAIATPLVLPRAQRLQSPTK